MTWHIERTGDRRLITQKIGDNAAVIGSIVKDGDKWLVEILWSAGEDGDYRFTADTTAEAVAFILGVEAAQLRLGRYIERIGKA